MKKISKNFKVPKSQSPKIIFCLFFFFQNLLLEAPAHFEEKISQLICISRYRDENIKILEKKFSKNFDYYDRIPLDLESRAVPHCLILIDDFEQELTSDRELLKMTYSFAAYVTHHLPCTLIMVCQSYSMFYASSKLHQALFQATMLILFKSHSSMNILKRVLNSFNIGEMPEHWLLRRSSYSLSLSEIRFFFQNHFFPNWKIEKFHTLQADKRIKHSIWSL